jgi:hypothetical protein
MHEQTGSLPMDYDGLVRRSERATFEWKTYPLITKSMFVNGEQTEVLIGGYDELTKLLSVGKQDIQWEMT